MKRTGGEGWSRLGTVVAIARFVEVVAVLVGTGPFARFAFVEPIMDGFAMYLVVDRVEVRIEIGADHAVCPDSNGSPNSAAASAPSSSLSSSESWSTSALKSLTDSMREPFSSVLKYLLRAVNAFIRCSL